MLQKSQQGLQEIDTPPPPPPFKLFESQQQQQQQCGIESVSGAAFAKAAGREPLSSSKPSEHSVPGEAAKKNSLRATIPNGIEGSVFAGGNIRVVCVRFEGVEGPSKRWEVLAGGSITVAKGSESSAGSRERTYHLVSAECLGLGSERHGADRLRLYPFKHRRSFWQLAKKLQTCFGKIK